MAEIGAQNLPLKGKGWLGMSSGSSADRRFILLENCYVDSDGQRICMTPGFRCVIDLESNKKTEGFKRRHPDARRPVLDRGADGAGAYVVPVTVSTQYFEGNQSRGYPGLEPHTADVGTQFVRSDVTHLHGFRMLRNKLVIYGEANYRREDVVDGGGVSLVVLGWTKSGNNTVLNCNAAQRGTFFGGCREGDIVTVEDLNDTNTADAAILNNRFHRVTAVVGANITVDTNVAASSNSSALTGSIYKTRSNQSYSFGDAGRSYYGEVGNDEIDDPESLAVWWVDDLPPIDGVVTQRCWPSYVFNRQRDFHGDRTIDDSQEGLALAAPGPPFNPGYSRRRQKRLPFRLVPDVGGGRLLLAAPGYGCCFQVPCDVPVNTRYATLPALGIDYWYNDIFDKPRSVGVPKGVMCDRHDPLVTGTASVITSGLITDDSADFSGTDLAGCVIVIEGVNATITGLQNGSVNTLLHGGWSGATPSPAPKTYRLHQDRDWLLVPSTVSGNNPDQFWPMGVYKFRVAYKDEATGEVGQWSEPVRIEVPDEPFFDATNTWGWRLRLYIMHPGYAMPETGALSCLIFMSKSLIGSEDAEYKHVRTVDVDTTIAAPPATRTMTGKYGLPKIDFGFATTLTPVFFSVEMSADYSRKYTHYIRPTLLPEFKQMPRGAKALRTVRDVTVYAGQLGDDGHDREIKNITASFLYEPLDNPPGATARDTFRRNQLNDELVIRAAVRAASKLDYLGGDSCRMAANHGIPNAYASIKVWSRLLFPNPDQFLEVEKQVNCRAPDSTATNNPITWTNSWVATSQASPDFAGSDDTSFRYRLRVTPLRLGTEFFRSVTGQAAALVMQRGQVQLSELGLPGETPGEGIQIVAPKREDDPVAVGEFRGVAIICTKRQTHTLRWDRGPAGAAPFLVSSQDGCVAPNTMGENDRYGYWIGERGVEAYTYFNTLEFVGSDIAEDFFGETARYKRDRLGLMQHAFQHHDEARGLVWFGMFADRNKSNANRVTVSYLGTTYNWDTKVGDPATATPDEARSRFPCDEIVVWSYLTGAFSRYVPPAGLEILDITNVRYDDGRDRVSFLARDKRIYAFDDLFSEDNAEVVRRVASYNVVDGTSLVVTAAFGTDVTARGAGTFVRPGHLVVITDPETFQVKHVATVTAANAATSTITLDLAGTWSKGDNVEIGLRTMTVETAYQQPKDGEPATLSAVKVRASIESSLTTRADGTRQRAWIRVTAFGNDHPDGMKQEGAADSRLFESVLTEGQGAQGWQFLGLSEEEPVVHTVRFSRGTVNATDIKAKIEVIGGAQVCLDNLIFEMG